MSILLDILMVALFVLPVYIGYKKGLISSVLDLVSFFISFFVAIYLCAFLGNDLQERIIWFLVIFVVVYIALIIIKRALNLISKLPVIRKLNDVFGAVFGAICGIVYFSGAALVLGALLDEATVEGTYVLYWATNTNIFYELFSRLA